MHIGEENGIEKKAIVIEWVISSALLKSNGVMTHLKCCCFMRKLL